jgi:hypothetical protein
VASGDRRGTHRNDGRDAVGAPNVRIQCNQYCTRGGGERSHGFPCTSKVKPGSEGSFPRLIPIASDTALMITVLATTSTIATMCVVMAQSPPTQLRRCPRRRVLQRAPHSVARGGIVGTISARSAQRRRDAVSKRWQQQLTTRGPISSEDPHLTTGELQLQLGCKRSPACFAQLQ